MKKLLVAAIGVAAAVNAFAGQISQQRFKEVTTDPITKDNYATILNSAALPSGSYWSDPADITNEYTVSAVTLSKPGSIDGAPGQALGIKTKFGKPLSVNIIGGGTTTNIPNSGLYFDSLVKFTVCDSEPTETYSGAKIIMWLQETETEPVQTNLYVRAGYLSMSGNNVVSTPTNYVCAVPQDFDIDGLNRVTIKAIADITSTGRGVPGFAIYINQSNGTQATSDINSPADKWDSTFLASELSEPAYLLNEGNALFPTMDLTTGNKDSLASVAFDGTGSITDIVFTDDGPSYAKDMASEKATIDGPNGPITGSPFTDFAAAVAAINNSSLAAGTYTMTLSRDLNVSETLAFTPVSGVNVVLDFNGKIITYSGSNAAISNGGTLTITNSSVVVGGIQCPDEGIALSDGGDGSLTIQAGSFWGHVVLNEEGIDNYSLTGGAFKYGSDDLEAFKSAIPAGKTLSQNQTGMWEIVDYVAPTYTITVAGGEHFTVAVTTNEVAAGAAGAYVVTEGDSVAVTYTAATGYTLSKYEDGIDPVSADATIAAPVATLQTFNVIFVDGDAATTNEVDYGTTLTAESAPAFVGRTGYTAAWDKTVAGTTVTAETTFTAQYTAIEYTIAYKNADGTAFTAWDSEASPTKSYTIADAVTLPTASDLDLGVLGVEFKGWTNETGTVTGWAAGATGDVTVYAKLETTGSSGYDGGDGSTFTVDAGAVATVEAKTGAKMTDTVAGKGMTYAQAYALGLVDEGTGDVADLETTIEIKDGKVVVGLSEEAKEAYTITLKVYEKSSLTADWPVNPTQTITLGTPAAAAGFNPGSAASGFYKTEVSISNK